MGFRTGTCFFTKSVLNLSRYPVRVFRAADQLSITSEHLPFRDYTTEFLHGGKKSSNDLENYPRNLGTYGLYLARNEMFRINNYKTKVI